MRESKSGLGHGNVGCSLDPQVDSACFDLAYGHPFPDAALLPGQAQKIFFTAQEHFEPFSFGSTTPYLTDQVRKMKIRKKKKSNGISTEFTSGFCFRLLLEGGEAEAFSMASSTWGSTRGLCFCAASVILLRFRFRFLVDMFLKTLIASAVGLRNTWVELQKDFTVSGSGEYDEAGEDDDDEEDDDEDNDKEDEG